jgi:probable rRNA maturation factor
MTNRKAELTLSVQHAVRHAASPRRRQVRHWLRAAQEFPAAVAVRFVAAEEGRALNRDYRHKDYATNVLSFIYESEPVVVGDLVVCVPEVLKEAQEQGKSVDAHFAHLIVHGMLHLQGYDHETGARDAARMEARERDILAGLGYPDPYS